MFSRGERDRERKRSKLPPGSLDLTSICQDSSREWSDGMKNRGIQGSLHWAIVTTGDLQANTTATRLADRPVSTCTHQPNTAQAPRTPPKCISLQPKAVTVPLGIMFMLNGVVHLVFP